MIKKIIVALGKRKYEYVFEEFNEKMEGTLQHRKRHFPGVAGETRQYILVPLECASLQSNLSMNENASVS